MPEFDHIIRGATVADGSGAPLREQDVAIRDGRIAAVGSVSGRSDREWDARGLLLTPGFVDIHTHYDGQVTWDDSLAPSSEHGVTTVVMGNCGVGFAPCRPGDRDALVRLMEGVEDLPEAVLTAGVPWAWESFPDYLDFLDGRAFDIDIAAQIPHAALRVHAMGNRALAHEPATEQDCQRMADLVEEAMRAGALGFSTSRSINHKASDGNPTPSLKATEAELTAIATAVGRSGRGVLQLISDFTDTKAEFAMIDRVIRAGGRPASISLMQMHDAPDLWREILGWIEGLNSGGQSVRGQVCGRPVGALMGFELSFNPFALRPSYIALAGLPFEQRIAELRKPEVRARILGENSIASDKPGASQLERFDMMFPLGDQPDYEPTADRFLPALAAARGMPVAEFAYDLLLERDGRTVLSLPSVNYASGSLDACSEMLNSDYTVPGLGDGGAHLGFLCDASLPTHMLSYWARDRQRGPRMAVNDVVRRLSRETAHAVGMFDRGVIAPGMKADINLIDFDTLALEQPHVTYDLPSGGRRVRQQAHGYVATFVNGTVIAENGIPTRERPGRLVRSAIH